MKQPSEPSCSSQRKKRKNNLRVRLQRTGKELMKMTAKQKTPSRKKESSAQAVQPLITKLYEGTADLIIKIPQKPKKNTGKTVPETEEPAKELIEITLPSISKTAEDSDRVAALVSSLISYLLKDIEAAKQTNRKAVQAEGIARAKAKGKRFGPESMTFDAELFENLCQAYRNKEISCRAAGDQLGCSSRTFLRRYHQIYPDK